MRACAAVAPRPVLVAPDSFKGTHSAARVAAAVVQGLETAGVPAEACPVADGGEGTLAVLLPALGGETRGTRAHDPLGRERAAGFALLEGGGTALLEVAEASGLALVEAPGPSTAWAASSRGTGELILAAVAEGAQVVVVGAGGSATTDGGAGALEAIADGGGLRGAQLVVLCDVTVAWEACAATFAPQKGADQATVARLAKRLDALAARLPRDPRGVPGAGAAGGLAGGLWAAHDAVLEPGAAWVLDALDFDGRLAGAAALVVGEGRLDDQSLQGKIVGELARRARASAVACHAIVGSLPTPGVPAQRAQEVGQSGWNPPGWAAGFASVRVASTLEELERAGAQLARELHPSAEG